MKKINRIRFLSLVLLVITLNFVFADTECIGRDCSIGISLNVLGNPTGAFAGFVRDLTGGLINDVNVSVLRTGYSSISINGLYNITEVPEGVYDLEASKEGFLSQTKTNQLIISEVTTEVDFNLGGLGGIKGNVRDFWTSVGIDNANLSLFLYDEFLDSALTNSSGYYKFIDLAPGYYDITVNATGFTLNSKPDNHVLGGENTTVDFWLW